jgi:cell division transport system permease protein
MKITLPKRKLKVLGVEHERSTYDFPFERDGGNRFLYMLIGLMTYLAVLASGAGLTLSHMADRWTTSLSGQMSAEISPYDPSGADITRENLQTIAKEAETRLKSAPYIHNVKLTSQKEVAKLVEPWLGENDLILNQVPLPILITFGYDHDVSDISEKVSGLLSGLPATIRIDGYQGWLHDVLRMTGTLSFTAYLVGFVTLITTIFAVSGAVRARIAAYHEQLEILHLIGAFDAYIIHQFQRHALTIAFKAAAAGFIAALLTFLLIDHLSSRSAGMITPSFILPAYAFGIFIAIPILACLMTLFTARLTVYQSLSRMT